MRSLVFLFTMFMALSVFGWRENISDCSQVMVGRDTLGNKVFARFLRLSDELEKGENPEDQFSIFTLKEKPFIVLSNQKEVAVYNFVTGELMTKLTFPKKIKFRTATPDGILITSNKLRGTVFQFYNYAGEKLWETKTPTNYFDTSKGIILSLNYANSFINSKYTIAGHDIKTGNKLWERNIKAQSPLLFCNPFNSSDSTKLYFTTDSLFSVDIISGTSRSHPFKTRLLPTQKLSLFFVNEPDTIHDPNLYIENIRSSIVPNKMTGLCSNCVERGDTLFIADVNALYAFNKDLEPYWRTPFPEKMGSKSTIRLEGDRLLLFNYGIGFHNERVKTQGKPFAMSVSIKDGKPIHTTIPNVDDHMISGVYSSSGKLYWLTRRDLYYCDEGESQLHKIDWKSRAKYYYHEQNLKYAICDTLWIVGNNKIEPIVSDDQQVVVGDWSKKEVHLIKPDGSEEIIPSKNLYSLDSQDAGKIFHLPDNTNMSMTDIRRRLSESEYLKVNPLTKKISLFVYTQAIYGDVDTHLVIGMEGGVGFIDLTEPNLQ